MPNPIITHRFTADPTVLLVDETIYLYTGHDEAPPGSGKYIMNNWCCFSSTDMVEWKEHPMPLKATDFLWAKGDAYASKVVHHNNKFYWYAAVTPKDGPGKAIGVAVSDRPEGPFRDAIGGPLINKTMIDMVDPAGDNFDPTVLINDDGSAWIFWGKKRCYYAHLAGDMLSIHTPIKTIELSDFQEGAHIHERNGWYYLSYGYQMPELVAYAMSRSVEGPWQTKGILNDVAGNCETNRPATLDFKGRSFLFYHNGNLPGGDSHHRSVCVDELFYNSDGTMRQIIMTREGVSAP